MYSWPTEPHHNAGAETFISVRELAEDRMAMVSQEDKKCRRVETDAKKNPRR